MAEKKESKKFAVIRTGGKQYKVSEGEILEIEKLNIEAGKKISLETLLITDGDKVEIGKPLIEKTPVQAKVIADTKGEKLIIFKYKAKKNERKKTGHRQKLTQIQIEKI